MNYRTFGRTGDSISEIGFGAWGISGKQWIGATDEESLGSLRRAVELGVNFIDTALAYGEGHSEILVGRAVRETGHKVYVASKVPPKNRLWPAQPGIGLDDVFPYQHIIECTETSLRNLKLEVIDFQQLHVWNPEWIGREEWRRAFEDLKKSGKARAVGISINDHQPDSALEILRTGLVDGVQVIYNIFDQTSAQNLYPLCQELNIGVIARVPFDEGSLTGTIDADTTFPEDDFRNSYFRGDRKQQVAQRIEAIRSDLGAMDGSMAEVALRFTISHPAVSTVIPGMRKIRNVEANCAASDKGPLEGRTLDILRRHAWNRNFYE
jgi:aryl-alcohol dehydrogenase-like predicted oxidoreductase